MTESNLPPAGWYPDPAGSGQERRWDGQKWTEELRAVGQNPDAQETAVMEPAAASAPAAYGSGPAAQAASGPAAQPAAGLPGPAAQPSSAGFWKSIFDFQLRADHSATLPVTRVIYVLWFVLQAFSVSMMVVGTIIALATGSFLWFGIMLILLIVVAFLALISIAGMRIGLEFLVATIQTARNSESILNHLRQRS